MVSGCDRGSHIKHNVTQVIKSECNNFGDVVQSSLKRRALRYKEGLSSSEDADIHDVVTFQHNLRLCFYSLMF